MSNSVTQLEQEIADLRISLATAGLPNAAVTAITAQIAVKEAALAALRGSAPAAPGSLIDFGQANQFDKVTTRDIVGQNLYKSTSRTQVFTSISIPARWIILLLALVVASLLAGFTWQNTKSLGWSVAGALVGGCVVVFLGFVACVIGDPAKNWSKLAADWLDQWIQLLIGGFGFEGRYRTFLRQEHRFFDVKGLTTQGPHSLQLQKVFVDLGLAPQEAQKASANPLRLPEPLRTGRHSVWDYLTAPQMEEQGLVILGPPGSGKTTLLRHIALTLAHGGSVGGRQIKGLPVLLALRNHAGAINANAQYSLPEAIYDHLRREEGPQVPSGWFAAQLQAGRCYVLLDGLDEISDPTLRQQVVAWVQHQIQAHPKNRFLISSRPFGYRENPLSGVTVLEVHPFTSSQVRRFVEQWYLANMLMSTQQDDEGVRRDARHGAADLLQRIKDTPALSDLAVNPLLLTMIANVHRHRSSLPGRRVELYAEICDVFLGKRQQARGLTLDLTPAQKQSILQPLAYHMMVRGLREIAAAQAAEVIGEPLRSVDLAAPPASFLSAIRDSSGIVLERENSVYGFTHLTFQEYLAAAYIKEQRLEAKLVAQVGTSWWHETILLYAAQGDASALVRACIAEERPSIPALMLAIELRDEARQIDPTVRTQLEALLTKGVDDPAPDRRQIIVEALLARRLRRMRRLDERRAIDTSLISHAEYQLFLDQQAGGDSYHQPAHWSAERYPSGDGHSPALGMRCSDAVAFCAWLSKRDPDEWSYRLPYSAEAQDWAAARKNTALVCWVDTEGGSSWPEPATIAQEQVQAQYDHDMTIGQATVLLAVLTQIDTYVEDIVRNIGVSFDFESIRNLVRDLVRDLAHASAGDLAPAFAHDLSDDLARARNMIPAFARDLADALARVRDAYTRDPAPFTRATRARDAYTHDLDHAFDRGYAPALARARDLARDRAYAHARAFDHDRASALDRALDRASALDRARFIGELFPKTQPAVVKFGQMRGGLGLERSMSIATQCDLQRDLARTKLADETETPSVPSGFALTDMVSDLLNRQAIQNPDLRDKRAELRLKVRLCCLALLLRIDARLEQRSVLARVTANAEIRELQTLRGKYEELYTSFAVLEQRIEGKLLPIEGILLVRERNEQAA